MLVPRPQAQAKAKALCLDARDKRIPLPQLAMADYPDLPADLFEPTTGMGLAASEAHAFAARAKAL